MDVGIGDTIAHGAQQLIEFTSSDALGSNRITLALVNLPVTVAERLDTVVTGCLEGGFDRERLGSDTARQ